MADGYVDGAFDITSDQTVAPSVDVGEGGYRPAGVVAKTQDTRLSVAEGCTLTVKGDTETLESKVDRLNGFASEAQHKLEIQGNVAADLRSNTERVTGLRANGGNVVVNGNLTATINSSSGAAYGVDAWEQNQVVLNGNNTFNVATETGRASGIDANNQSQVLLGTDAQLNIHSRSESGLALGIASYSNSRVDLRNCVSTINVASSTNRIVGLAAESGSSLELGDAVVNLNADGYYFTESNNNRWIQGLYSASGSVHATGTLVFNVTSHDDAGNLIDAGDMTAVRVINLEGSDYSTNASVDGDLAINVHSQVGNVYGVYVSGDAYSDETLHAEVSVEGTLSVNVSGNNEFVNGVYAQGESGVEASRITVNVSSQGHATQVAGLVSMTNPSSYPGSGKIIARDGYTASISGTGNLYGIVLLGEYEDRPSIVELGGSSSIVMDSSNDAAMALEVGGGAHGSVSNLVATVKAKTDAVGLNLYGGEVTFAGITDLVVTGENSSVGLEISSDSSLKVVGQASVEASTALRQAEGATTFVGSDSASGIEEPSVLKLSGAVENKGAFSLHNATLAIEGKKNDLFNLGDISARSGSAVDIGAGEYLISCLTGDDDKVLRFNDLSASVKLGSTTGKTTIAASGKANDSVSDVLTAAQTLREAVKYQNPADEQGQSLFVEEGLVNDGLTADLDSEGKLTNIVTTKNTKLDALSSVASLSLMSWRHEATDLFNRMPRNSPRVSVGMDSG